MSKQLQTILPKNSGRNNTGHVTVRHQGGRQKRYYRDVDFKRNKLGVTGTVVGFEYDPNRNVDVTLIQYRDGDKRYILKPVGLSVGDTIVAGKNSDVRPGNALSLGDIPVGTQIHNIELNPGNGGQLVRGAGSTATILAKEGGYAHVKLPSGETRRIKETCFATIGQLSNVEWKSRELGTAGRARRRGIRPTVRGVAQNPRSHPHGGGEGRSGEGLKQPKTPWGKPARGLKTRNKGKYSNRMILQGRKK